MAPVVILKVAIVALLFRLSNGTCVQQTNYSRFADYVLIIMAVNVSISNTVFDDMSQLCHSHFEGCHYCSVVLSTVPVQNKRVA